jgi:hypothetical protein
VGDFFLTMLARIDKGLEPVARLTPLHYYQSGEAIAGLNGAWLAGLLGVAALLGLAAWWRFERRDIRVSGERVWRWPWRWPRERGKGRDLLKRCKDRITALATRPGKSWGRKRRNHG